MVKTAQLDNKINPNIIILITLIAKKIIRGEKVISCMNIRGKKIINIIIENNGTIITGLTILVPKIYTPKLKEILKITNINIKDNGSILYNINFLLIFNILSTNTTLV